MILENIALKWLKDGEQTKITPDIKILSKKIKGRSVDHILEWLKNNIKSRTDLRKEYFRERTADDILKSKFSTGCTDYALAFIVLCRSKKIPSKYIETIHKNYKFGQRPIMGHIFSKVFIDNKWIIVDPASFKIRKSYFPYKVVGHGFDSWNLGVHNFNDLKILLKKYFSQKTS